jgi:hypothetical protein
MNVSLIVANGKILREDFVGKRKKEWFLPIIDYELKTSFVLKITKVIVTDNNSIVICCILQNKSLKIQGKFFI